MIGIFSPLLVVNSIIRDMANKLVQRGLQSIKMRTFDVAGRCCKHLPGRHISPLVAGRWPQWTMLESGKCKVGFEEATKGEKDVWQASRQRSGNMFILEMNIIFLNERDEHTHTTHTTHRRSTSCLRIIAVCLIWQSFSLTSLANNLSTFYVSGYY